MVTAASQSSRYCISESALQQIRKDYGTSALHRFKALEKLLNDALAFTEAGKLTAVNDFFNKVHWTSDEKVWGQEDYWATPVEFLGRNEGDCEDFVIAKYTALKRLGVPDSKLYLTYAEAVSYRQRHMVLSYYETPKSVPLILDNLNGKVLPGTARSDLRPIYSFNGEALFLAKERGIGKRIPGAFGKKWEDFFSRLEKGTL
jgi:predicted transglutaminase-like cysteine proteinase